jgi:hypothetical protein
MKGTRSHDFLLYSRTALQYLLEYKALAEHDIKLCCFICVCVIIPTRITLIPSQTLPFI